MKDKIHFHQGDITDAVCEAIVNAANNHLWMGAGVAGAIKRKGGIIIEQEAIAKGPIEVGDAIETTAGKLNAKYVIHAAVMGQDLKTSEEYIRQATKSVLEICEKLHLKSVAFPAFGTGVGGFPKDKCAEIMLNEIINFSPNSIEEVHFYPWDAETKRIFEDKLRELKILRLN